MSGSWGQSSSGREHTQTLRSHVNPRTARQRPGVRWPSTAFPRADQTVTTLTEPPYRPPAVGRASGTKLDRLHPPSSILTFALRPSHPCQFVLNRVHSRLKIFQNGVRPNASLTIKHWPFPGLGKFSRPFSTPPHFRPMLTRVS